MRLDVLCLTLLIASLVDAKNQDDDVDDTDEGTVRSKPVVVRLPKNRLSPELHSISSLREQIRSSSIDRVIPDSPPATLPPATLPPAPAASPHPAPTSGPSQIRVPSATSRPSLQLPQLPGGSPLSAILPNNPGGGSALSGILANNPGLLKFLQGIGAPPGLGGSAGPQLGPAAPGVAGLGSGLGSGLGAGFPGIGGFGSGLPQSGLLAPVQGALPSLGQPPPFPGLPGVSGAFPPGAPDAGLLNVISSLGRQFGGAGM